MESNASITQPKDFVKPLDQRDRTSISMMLEQQRNYQRIEESGMFSETALKNNFGNAQFFWESGEVTALPQRNRRDIFALLKAGRALLNAWVQKSRGRRQLSTMNEIALKDIGTTRIEAKVEANKWFWQN